MVIWLIGMSGAGKTYIGRALYETIKQNKPNTVFLDGDLVREVMGNDLGHTLEDRKKNADRICRLCRMLDQQEIHVICSILSLFHESQDWNRANLSSYFEIYIDTPMELLTERRPFYQQALEGKMKNVIGIDIPFNPPKKPNLVIHNHSHLESPEPVVCKILASLPPF